MLPNIGTSKTLRDLTQVIVALPSEAEMPKAVMWFIRDYMKQKFTVALTKAEIANDQATVAALKDLWNKLTQETL